MFAEHVGRNRATTNASTPSVRWSSVSTAIPPAVTSPYQTHPQVARVKEMQGSSEVWKSTEFRVQEDWKRVGARLQRMYTHHAQVPRNLKEYLEQRIAKQEWELVLLRKKLDRFENKSQTGIKPTTFASSYRYIQRGAVLPAPTAFSAVPKGAPCCYGCTVWPSPEEYRYEGDGRVVSGYGRFLPMPRAWLPETRFLPWDQIPALQQWDLDNNQRERERPRNSAPEQQAQQIHEADERRLLSSHLRSALGGIDWDEIK